MFLMLGVFVMFIRLGNGLILLCVGILILGSVFLFVMKLVGMMLLRFSMYVVVV